MNQEPHRSAEQLILQQRVEGLSAAEGEWLERHLESCPACARTAAATGEALRRLRAVSVPLPPALGSRTQLRVYLRARERREQHRGSWALWISCVVSWAVGIMTAPYVWHGFRWLGESAGVPATVWKMGFGLWWALPALLAVALLLIERGGRGIDRRSEHVRS
jgi:predicted anti-sigma-YlaC factor YlaD